MFLALTAIEKYWDKSKEILFLGDWCITNKSNLNNIKFKVLDYHWKDFKKIESDNDYIFKVYKSLMPLLAEKLNKIHNTKLPFRYWEILVGVWLVKFIELSFDRYSTIIQLRKLSDKIDCWVTDEYLIPPTFNDFYWFSQEDKYNFSFFSSIINKLKLNINLTHIDFDPDNIPSSVQNNINDYDANKRKKLSKNIIQKIKRIKGNVMPVNANWFKSWTKRYNTLTKIKNDAEDLVVSKGNIVSIGNKIKKKLPKFQYMGIVKINRITFDKLEKFYKEINNKKISLTEFINETIKSKIAKFKYSALKNYWYEVDNYQDLKFLKKDIKNILK